MSEINLEDEIMGGVRFDENGLPIVEGVSAKTQPQQQEKKILLKPSEREYDGVPQSKKPVNPIIASIEPDTITAIKALIKKAKKSEKSFNIFPCLSTISNEMYNVIVQTYEEISEEEISKIMFDLVYNPEEIKNQIFEQFVKAYKNEKGED